MKIMIKEFAKLSGVSVRTLHYYDEIELLKPAIVDEQSGYRYYNEQSILRMQEILFLRELDFSLNSIKEILSSTNYDKEKVMKERKQLLTLKKERLEKLISAIDDAVKGKNVMKAFESNKIEAYKIEAKERWGKTEAYSEYSEKTKDYSPEKNQNIIDGLDAIFKEFSECKKCGDNANSDKVQNLVKKLQGYITDNFYTCTNEILSSLGQMYVLDERFTNNINKHGEGTAELVGEAINTYISRN